MKTEPKFTEKFGTYVCEGDSITLEHNGITYTARIERDDDYTPPDERQDGYWPSLDPKDAGYIGPKSESTLRRHMQRATEVLEAWKNDEWFYCGVAISASVDGVELDSYAASLWGIEANYPESYRNRNPNIYLTTVANEILDQAVESAEKQLAELVHKAKGTPYNPANAIRQTLEYLGATEEGPYNAPENIAARAQGAVSTLRNLLKAVQ